MSSVSLRPLRRVALSFRPRTFLALFLAAAPAVLPSRGRACACGCGIYEVGSTALLPSGSGVTAFVDYDFQDQDHNWSGGARAPAGDNPDKDIRTALISAGFQAVLSPRWSVRLDAPYIERSFQTTGGLSGSDLVSLHYAGLGDVRLQATYTGFSPGLTTGLSLGLKLATGSFTQNDAYGDIDRDTELGSGSTDLLLGAFHRFGLDAGFRWNAFVQALLDVPVVTQQGYRPGAEFDAAWGVDYRGWTIGPMTIAPTAVVKAALRQRDGGPGAAQPVASGFERLILAPGVEFSLHPVRLHADVEVPVLQHFTGNQLASAVLFRVELSYGY